MLAGLGAGFGFGGEAGLISRSALGFGAIEVGDRAAGQAAGVGIDLGLEQEGGKLAHRDGEVEGRIGAVVADRAERVHADHAPAGIEQRSAGVARTERGGVEKGVERARRASAREIAPRLHGFLRRHEIGHRQALCEIDIAGVADGVDFRAIARRAWEQRDRRQGAAALDAQQGKVVTGRIGDELGRVAVAALGRDHTRDQRVVAAQFFDDMGVGDDKVRRDRKAGAMGDQSRPVSVAFDDDHADDRAACGADVCRVSQRDGGRCQCQVGDQKRDYLFGDTHERAFCADLL